MNLVIEVVEYDSVIEIVENVPTPALFPEKIILSQEDIDKKFITLTKTPKNDFVYFLPSGGLPQRCGRDFELDRTQKKISWANYQLETILEKDDWVELFYSV
jgi:hypothetical protein